MTTNRYDKIMQKFGSLPRGSYDNRGIFRSVPPTYVTEAKLIEFENALGHSLPSDYRHFLRDYSGHTIRNTALYPLQNTAIDGGISLFFDLQDGELLNRYRGYLESAEITISNYSGLLALRPLSEYEVMVFKDDKGSDYICVGWPSELLPIADNGGNNNTCIVISGEQKGSIYYMVNYALPDESNFYLAARSFDEFMHLLRPQN